MEVIILFKHIFPNYSKVKIVDNQLYRDIAITDSLVINDDFEYFQSNEFSKIDNYFNDYFIETGYTVEEMENLKFQEKLEKFNSRNDCDIILKNIYKIFLIIRNANEHAKSSIQIKNNTISINRKRISLKISIYGYNLLCSSIEFLFLNKNFPPKYLTTIIANYYNSAKKEIILFEKYGKKESLDLHDLDNIPSVNINFRNIYIIENFSMKSNKLFFEVNKLIINAINNNQAFDFYLAKNDSFYIVPSEFLDYNLSIDIDLLNEFKLNEPV